ncbi:MAG: hypothetical protein PSV46_08400 [Reyranella sp.]|nr:hypothetical protein [Reyranella sp.]
MTTYSIVQIGSDLTGWAIEIDGLLCASHPSLIYLAAHIEATLKGAEEREAALIAKAIAARPWPNYEERLAHFTVTGPWKPALDPFKR